MSRHRAFELFRDFYAEIPYVQVWEVNGEVITGMEPEIGYKLLSENDVNSLTERALQNRELFDLIIMGINFALRNGLPIPKPARLFLADFLEDPSIKPTKVGGRNPDYYFNWTLRLALLQLAEDGINPTKNEATDPDKECGIDIILGILEELGKGEEHNFESLRRRYQRVMKKFPRTMPDKTS